MQVRYFLIELLDEKVMEKGQYFLHLNDRFIFNHPAEEYVQNNCNTNTWGSFIALVMILFYYEVNIETISNLNIGLISSHTCIFYGYLKYPTIITMYLYYYVFTWPNLSLDRCDHYGLITINTCLLFINPIKT